MPLAFGDPMGPEMTLPPFALARSVGALGVVEMPLIEAAAAGETLAAALSSFLGIVWVRLALSTESPRASESPRLGIFCSH